MRTMKSRMMFTAVSTAALLALAACAESASSQDPPADTVAIDVGNDMKINLKTSPNLKVAVFLPGVANAYGQAQELAAKETAKDLGMDMTLFDGGYNPSQQLNQMQTALASGGATTQRWCKRWTERLFAKRSPRTTRRPTFWW